MEASPPTAASPDVDPAEEVDLDDDDDDIDIRVANGYVYQFPSNKPLYTAHGKWSWVNDHDFLSIDAGTPLGHGLEGHVNLKTSHINERKVVYISKLTSVWDSWRLFFASLYLNASSKYLRPLQGDCVPWIIGVRHCLGGRVGVAQDLPHPKGWREADMFLEESQKEAVIAAYKKLHDRGILHGDAEYRHMLIGNDGKVTIIDFGLSRVLDPDEWARKAGLESCSRLCLRNEMRKVKFLLDWKDSRDTEFRLAKLRSAREERDSAVADEVMKAKTDPFEKVDVPKEPMSEEEKVNPDGGLRLCDLDVWSHGDTWVAHRYEVNWTSKRAKLKKTEIPRPSIPAEETTKESVTPVALVPVAVDSSPATAQMPAIEPASTIDPPASTNSSGKLPLQVERPMVPDEQKNEQENRGLERANAMIFKYPARKRSLEEELEKVPEERTNVNVKGKAVARKTDDINEPTRKRLKITEVSATPALVSIPNFPSRIPGVVRQPLITEVHDFSGSMMSSTSSNEAEANDSMKFPLLDEDAADPTPYELNPEARAFLRGEAARGFARFIAANTRVQPLERQLDQENHNLEMRRSELLRVMLMLPREDRTTIWTNMGQPDARTLLGLLPEPPGSIERSNELLDVQRQLEHTEAAPQSSSSKASVPKKPSMLSRESDQGLLEAQKVQAKANSRQKLQSRLDMERNKDSFSMPPPPLPVIRSSRTDSQSDIPQRSSMARVSQRNTSRQDSTSQSSPATSPTRSASTVAHEQSVSSSREHPYYVQLRKVMDESRKAHPERIFSVTIPPEVLAWEAKATRKFPTPEGPSKPTSRGITRTPTPHPSNTLRGTASMSPTVIKSGTSKESEAKRKREDTADSQTLRAADGGQVEQRDPKRRKTENCDLV